MKIVRVFATLVVLIFADNQLCAQITIGGNLLQSMFAPGSGSSIRFADSWTLDNFNSQTGDNQTWDFSSVTWPNTPTYTQVVQSYPSGTLLENENFFQTATHTSHATVEFQGTTLITDRYFQVSNDIVVLMGIAQNADFDADGDLENGAFVYTPGETLFSFPIEMGSSWQSENMLNIVANGSEVGDLGERTTHTITGWGQANLLGVTADCLRDDFKTEFACASGAGYCSEASQISLYCIPQTDGPLYFLMLTADLNTDGTIADIGLWAFDTSLVLSNANDIPNSLSKIEAYPNPFHDSVDLHFDLESSGQIEVSIFDLLGQRVGEITNQIMAPGEKKFVWRPSSHLPNATYIVEYKHNGLSTHQKITLLR